MLFTRRLLVALFFFVVGLAIRSPAWAEPGGVDPIPFHEYPGYDSLVCGGPDHPPCREMLLGIAGFMLATLAVVMLILGVQRVIRFSRCPQGGRHDWPPGRQFMFSKVRCRKCKREVDGNDGLGSTL